ncbi:MAG TPA: 3-oxoacyl-ACP synthase III family protein [Candidatus Kapabacteria bacterium]|nr:3-oxoacyl-ACP synthase III family protein [Candidatus Kapabacteria bacterium]
MTIQKKFALSGLRAVKSQVPVGIVGVGAYLPPTILKNEDFVNIQLSEDAQKLIKEYFGFHERRFAKGESFTDMEVNAAKKALEDYSIDPLELDMVISTHCSRDMSRLSPPNANYIQTKIGADNAVSFNVDGGFNGWLSATLTAVAFISSGFYNTALVVTGESAIRELPCTQFSSLFMGDGAGAFILKRLKDNEEGLLAFHLMSRECVKAARIQISGGYGNYDNSLFDVRPFVAVAPESLQRDLPFVEKYIPYSIEQSLNAAGLVAQDINLFILGQQFLGLNKTWAYNLGVGYEKIHDTLAKYGCMKNASISISTDDALKSGKIKKGDIIAFGDQGANWSISSAIFKWCI